MTRHLFGLDPVPVPPHVFALDAHELRYGWFRGDGGELELARYRATRVEKDMFASGPVGGPMHDPEELRMLLSALQESLAEPITEASIVLPDAWLRVAFVEAEDLPRSSRARDEILRWKLQRIVPFRVEELRLAGVDAAEITNNGSTPRILIAFALEALLRQLEGAFEARGIHLGLITNESLACLSAGRDALRDVELGAIVVVTEAGYSLVFVLRDEPILQRFKALPQLAGDEPSAQLIQRDLKLTEVYLREQLTQLAIGRVVLAAPPEIEERWLEWLSDGFGLPAHPLRPEHLGVTLSSARPAMHELGPLAGVARMEVQ